MVVRSNIVTVEVIPREIPVRELRLRVDRTRVRVGEPVKLTFTVVLERVSPQPVTVHGAVYINRRPWKALDIPVAPGSDTGSTTLTWTPDRPGKYEIYGEVEDKVRLVVTAYGYKGYSFLKSSSRWVEVMPSTKTITKKGYPGSGLGEFIAGMIVGAFLGYAIAKYRVRLVIERRF